MRSANQVIASHSPSGFASKPAESSRDVTPRTEKLVALLWARFSDLFGDKWRAKAGDITGDDGTYSQTFLLWCRKLSGLTQKQFAHGMSVIEERGKQAGAAGREFWPPSYAEFMGFAGQSAQHALQSRPVHEVLAESRGHRPAIEDKTAIEQRKQINRERMAAMRAETGV